MNPQREKFTEDEFDHITCTTVEFFLSDRQVTLNLPVKKQIQLLPKEQQFDAIMDDPMMMLEYTSFLL